MTMTVPSEWSYLERKFPGSYLLWKRDVGIATTKWLLGVTGLDVAVAVSPKYVTDVTCDLYYHLCTTGWVCQHVKHCKKVHLATETVTLAAEVPPPSRTQSKSRFQSRVSGDSFFWRGRWRRC